MVAQILVQRGSRDLCEDILVVRVNWSGPGKQVGHKDRTGNDARDASLHLSLSLVASPPSPPPCVCPRLASAYNPSLLCGCLDSGQGTIPATTKEGASHPVSIIVQKRVVQW